MKFCVRFLLAMMSLLAVTAVLVACGSSPKLPLTNALAYVAHPQSHSVSVIDIPANQTINTIQVGNTSTGSTASYPQTVAVTPDRTRAYVPDGNASVWVIDTKTKLVTTTIPVPHNARLTLSPDGSRAYVGAIYGVAVIDTASNSLMTMIPLGGPPNQYAFDVAVSPDSRRVYVTNQDGNNIWVIDAATSSVVGNIVTPNTANLFIAVAPDGNHAYAAGFLTGNNAGNFVDVIDLRTNTVSSTIPLGGYLPAGIALTPDGNRIFVVTNGGYFDAFDVATNTPLISTRISSTGLLGLAFTPNGSHVYLTGGSAGNIIYVLDASTYGIVNTINTHDFSLGLTIVPTS